MNGMFKPSVRFFCHKGYWLYTMHILLHSVKNRYIFIGCSRESVFVVANSNTCLGNLKHQITGGWSCNTPHPSLPSQSRKMGFATHR